MRVSVTTVEQYRLVITTDWCEESQLIASLRGERKPTREMEVGTAFHAAMAGLPYQGCTFNAGDIERARKHVGPGVSEVKTTLDLGDVRLVGMADLVWGNFVHDYKCKFTGAPDARDYELSLQWRMYLWMFGATRFTYDCFSFASPKPNTDLYTLKEIISFTFWAYPELERDCTAWVRRFVDWAQVKGLLGYLEREGSSLGVQACGVSHLYPAVDPLKR